MANMGSKVRKDKRITIALRDGLKCSRCGRDLRFPNTPRDGRKIALLSHEIPRSAGGTDANRNLTLICIDCERKRHEEYLPSDIFVNGEYCSNKVPQEKAGDRLRLKLVSV